ncbi:hypothetical protein [Neptuniibacter sp. QD37_11]|uniref:hypothetical protein n=1 Tax=Neptuniibacter sp. QD37_11 TaxID=3398209 RepID=UPI0039F4D27B
MINAKRLASVSTGTVICNSILKVVEAKQNYSASLIMFNSKGRPYFKEVEIEGLDRIITTCTSCNLKIGYPFPSDIIREVEVDSPDGFTLADTIEAIRSEIMALYLENYEKPKNTPQRQVQKGLAGNFLHGRPASPQSALLIEQISFNYENNLIIPKICSSKNWR